MKSAVILFVLTISLSKVVLAENQADKTAKGIVFYVAYTYEKDTEAKVGIYTSLSNLNGNYHLEMLNGSTFEVGPTLLRSVIEVPQLGGNFAYPSQFNNLKKTLLSLEEARKRFPQSQTIIDPLIPKITGILDRGEKGMVFIDGQWLTKAEVRAKTTMPNVEDKSIPKATPARKIIQTIDGRSYELKRVKRYSSNEIEIYHDGGIATLLFANLTDDSKQLLAHTSGFIEAKRTYDAQIMAEEKRRVEMEARQKELQREKERLKAKVEKYSKQFKKFEDALENGDDLEFESSNQVCEYLIYHMILVPIPRDIPGAKNWIKSRFGTPDSSNMGDFTNERMLNWVYYSYVKNPDTEKFEEAARFAFSGSRGVFFRVDGPEETAGGSTNAFGQSSSTYRTVETLLKYKNIYLR